MEQLIKQLQETIISLDNHAPQTWAEVRRSTELKGILVLLLESRGR